MSAYCRLTKQAIDAFLIDLDHYSNTDHPTNAEMVKAIYQRADSEDAFHCKDIQQYYDTEANMFLPDRMLKGTCPKCGALDQYGDNCEVCGATYATHELINPRSSLNGSTPYFKGLRTYFFQTQRF